MTTVLGPMVGCNCEVLHAIYHLRQDLQATNTQLTGIETKQETIVSSIADIQATADLIATTAAGIKTTADNVAADVQRLLAAVAANDPAAVNAAATSLQGSLASLQGTAAEMAATDTAGGEPPAPPAAPAPAPSEPPAEPIL